MLERAYSEYANRFEQGRLDENDFSRLISAARALGRNNVAERVEAQRDKLKVRSPFYDPKNLLTHHDEALMRKT